MKIITGRAGKPHVTANDFRQVFEGVIGDTDHILRVGDNMQVVISSNNLLKIQSGVMIHHGNLSIVQADTVDSITVSNGSQGMKRIDLIVNRYEKSAETGEETNKWVLIKGTPSSGTPKVPAHKVGDLRNGDLIDDCPFCKVYLEGVSIKRTEIIPTLAASSDGILDIISQFADEIIEGEVPGGKYKAIKHVDGRMEMTITKTFPAFSSNDWEEHSLPFGNFPIPFKEAPSVTSVVNVGIGGTPYRAAFMGVDTLTGRGIKSLYVYRPDNSPNVWLTFTVKLEGKWK